MNRPEKPWLRAGILALLTAISACGSGGEVPPEPVAAPALPVPEPSTGRPTAVSTEKPAISVVEAAAIVERIEAATPESDPESNSGPIVLSQAIAPAHYAVNLQSVVRLGEHEPQYHR